MTDPVLMPMLCILALVGVVTYLWIQISWLEGRIKQLEHHEKYDDF